MPEVHQSSVLFRSGLVTVGRFRVTPGHQNFSTAGDITGPTFVFPHRSVWIEHCRKERFIADPTVVTFYNVDADYRREAIDPAGDDCHWFEVQPELLAEVVAAYFPKFEGAADNVRFPTRHGPTDRTACLAERLLIRDLAEEPADDLRVEETVVAMLSAVMARTLDARLGPKARRSSRPPDFDVADQVRLTVLRNFTEPRSLADIAKQIGLSVFHLCRSFRARYGGTIHGYRTELRLHAALDQMHEAGEDLTTLALNLGYSSHSHFTSSFRRAFGVTPSQFRSGNCELALRIGLRQRRTC